MRLFHLITPDAWAAAVAAGEYRPPSLASEGFVHFSAAEQVEGTANLLYREVADLVVIEFDPDRFGGLEVVLEAAPGTGQSFPHVYGPIPASAAVAQHELRRTVDRGWAFDTDRLDARDSDPDTVNPGGGSGPSAGGR